MTTSLEVDSILFAPPDEPEPKRHFDDRLPALTHEQTVFVLERYQAAWEDKATYRIGVGVLWEDRKKKLHLSGDDFDMDTMGAKRVIAWIDLRTGQVEA